MSLGSWNTWWVDKEKEKHHVERICANHNISIKELKSKINSAFIFKIKGPDAKILFTELHSIRENGYKPPIPEGQKLTFVVEFGTTIPVVLDPKDIEEWIKANLKQKIEEFEVMDMYVSVIHYLYEEE